MKERPRKQIDVLNVNEERHHATPDTATLLLDREGIVQSTNEAIEALTGYEQAEIQGQHFGIFYPDKEIKTRLLEHLLNKAIANGSATHEGWLTRKDGSAFRGSITITAMQSNENALAGFSMLTLTTSDRLPEQWEKYIQQLEQKIQLLKKSEEQYHQMIAEVQDYAIIFLDVDGIIRNWNTGAEFIKGYSAEIIGKHFRIFYTPEDQANNVPQNLLDIAKHSGKATLEGWRVRKDGSQFWGSIVITALHNKDGGLIGFSKVTRDLTEKKLAQDKLLAYNAELESKNRELEQFAYVASHDMQEPLRKIRTFAEFAQRNLKNEYLANQYLEKINLSAVRMTTLIRSVLDYTRLTKDSTRHDDVNLNEILSQAKADLELMVEEKDARIIADVLPVIKGDPLQLAQLFGNLISNALKFSDKTPELIIKSRLVNTNDVIDCPAYLPETNYIELQFVDNGIGFEQQYGKQIFNMFQRLHVREEYPGAGVGLSLCRRIVENHKGHLSVRSELGKGATFYVFLPAG